MVITCAEPATTFFLFCFIHSFTHFNTTLTLHILSFNELHLLLYIDRKDVVVSALKSCFFIIINLMNIMFQQLQCFI